MLLLLALLIVLLSRLPLCLVVGVAVVRVCDVVVVIVCCGIVVVVVVGIARCWWCHMLSTDMQLNMFSCTGSDVIIDCVNTNVNTTISLLVLRKHEKYVVNHNNSTVFTLYCFLNRPNIIITRNIVVVVVGAAIDCSIVAVGVGGVMSYRVV